MKFMLASFSIASVLTLPVPAQANQTGLLEMDLEQLLQVNITGATLRQESIKTVPSSTTVFTRAQLDALGLDYLHELLNLVPGFQTTRGADVPFSYAFSLRGRRQGGQSREVLLLIDGRVITDPRSGGIESAMHLYPLANIEQIEIIRGPASAIYGSGAFTGVIHIVSRKQANQLKLSVGENNKRTADVNLSAQGNDWQTHLYTRFAQDDGERYRIGNQLTRDPQREFLMDWNVKYRNTQLQAMYSDQTAEDFYVLEKINNGLNHYSQLFHHLRLNQEFIPTESWKMNLAVSHEYAEQELIGMILPAGALANTSQPSSDDPLLTRGLLESEAYRVNLTNDVDITTRLSTQFGIEWQHQREIHARAENNYDLAQWAARQVPVTYYGADKKETQVGEEASRDVSGIYTQWIYQLSDDTRVTAGLRYDYYQSLDTHISPRLGLVHQLNEIHSIKLLYSEAFRAPTLGETHLMNNRVLVGNPDLNSESVKSSEIIWVGTWSQLTLGGTFYYNIYENPITAGFDGSTRTYINGTRQENYGLGGRINWQVNPNWMLSGNISSFHQLPDAYFREADTLSALGVNYQRGNWNWNLSAVYQGTRDYQLTTTQREQLKHYWYGNTQLLYQLGKKTSVALAIKNVLDKNYATPAQGTGLVGGVPNRGREASVVWQWGW